MYILHICIYIYIYIYIYVGLFCPLCRSLSWTCPRNFSPTKMSFGSSLGINRTQCGVKCWKWDARGHPMVRKVDPRRPKGERRDSQHPQEAWFFIRLVTLEAPRPLAIQFNAKGSTMDAKGDPKDNNLGNLTAGTLEYRKYLLLGIDLVCQMICKLVSKLVQWHKSLPQESKRWPKGAQKSGSKRLFGHPCFADRIFGTTGGCKRVLQNPKCAPKLKSYFCRWVGFWI